MTVTVEVEAQEGRRWAEGIPPRSKENGRAAWPWLAVKRKRKGSSGFIQLQTSFGAPQRATSFS
jgi:hypothetical protein